MIRQLLAEGFEPRISAKRHQRRVRFWPHCIVTKTLRSRRRHDIAGAKSTFVYREPEDPHPRVKVIPIVKVSESEDEDGNTGGLRAVCLRRNICARHIVKTAKVVRQQHRAGGCYRIRKHSISLKKIRYSLAKYAAPGLPAAPSVRKQRVDWYARHGFRYKEAHHGINGSRRRMPATMSAVFI